jgi:hypothetical protein
MARKTALVQLEERFPVEKKVDQGLVDATVAWIQAKLAETLHRGLADIGDHLLDTFFGGDPELAQSRAPNKARSFRALVQRCDTVELPLRSTALYGAIQAAGMRRRLGAHGSSFRQLPPTHQLLLLPLRDPNVVEEVATRALATQLSVRGLREAVGEELARAREGETRGRKPRPTILKTLDRSLRLFTLENGRRSFGKAHFDELTQKQARDALHTARELAESVERLIEKLASVTGM